jgi:hypothetical protein
MVSSVPPAESTKLIPLPAPTVEPHAVAKRSPVRRAVWQRRYGIALLTTDFVVVSTAAALAQIMRFGTRPATLVGFTWLGYSVISALLVGSWVWFLMIYRTRAPGVIGGTSEEYRRVWTATLSLFGGIAIVSTLFRVDIARGYLAIALPLGLVGLSANRFLVRKVVAAMRRRGRLLSAVLALASPTLFGRWPTRWHATAKMATPS